MGGVETDYKYIKGFYRFFVNLSLDEVCVPVFFLISGFLFFINAPEKYCKDWFFKKWMSRGKSLLIPYIIANSVFIIALGLLRVLQGLDVNINWVLHGFWDGEHGASPAAPPLWFIRDLMIAVAFSPLLYVSIRKTSWLMPLLLGAIWFTDIPVDFFLWKSKAFFFFSVGACFAIRGIDWVALIKNGWWTLLYLVLYLAVLIIFEFHFRRHIMLNFTVLFGCPLYISIASTLAKYLKRQVSQKMVAISFFVFMYHFYLCAFMWRPYCALLGTSEMALFLSYGLGVFTTIVLLGMLYILINKFFPKVSMILIGGRG